MCGFLVYTYYFSLCVTLIYSASIPSYIKRCAVNNPDLSACVLKTGREILKEFSKEDPVLGLKSLDPLYVGKVQIAKRRSGNGIGISIDNSYIEGLSNADIQNLTVNLEEKWISIKFKATVILKGDYVVDGRILLLPITGQGDMSLKIRDTVCDYLYKNVIYNDQTGEPHGKIEDDTLNCIYGKTTFKLNNLFGGNKLLSDNMNRILSENWKEVMKEVSLPVLDAIRRGVKDRINDFYSKVSYDDLLPNSL